MSMLQAGTNSLEGIHLQGEVLTSQANLQLASTASILRILHGGRIVSGAWLKSAVYLRNRHR